MRRFVTRFLSLLAIFVAFAILQPTGILSAVKADTFGSGLNNFDIEFVTIGDPGNPGDPSGSPFNGGAVDYEYRIGKYEISEDMVNKANDSGGLGITHDNRGANQPATSVSWFEAARFVNWLNTSTGGTEAYKFDSGGDFQLWAPGDPGYNPANPFRNSFAKYVLPSADEWYKAAYYDPTSGVYFDYPTGSDAVPDGIDFVGDPDFDAVYRDPDANPQPNNVFDVGVPSPYGTEGQGGNVSEWVETAFDLENSSASEQRGKRGGSWGSTSSILSSSNSGIGTNPAFEADFIGFRIASIPEPASLQLFTLVLVIVAALNRQIRQALPL